MFGYLENSVNCAMYISLSRYVHDAGYISSTSAPDEIVLIVLNLSVSKRAVQPAVCLYCTQNHHLQQHPDLHYELPYSIQCRSFPSTRSITVRQMSM